MSFRDEPPAAGAEPAGDEGVYDQGTPGSVQPDAPGAVEPGGSVQEPSATGAPDAGAVVDQSGAATPAGNMLPDRESRRFGIERLLVRLIATAGIVGIGVAIGAILAASKVQGWIIGLAVAIVSVVLSAVLWSSRQL